MRLKPGIILALIEISHAWNFINFMTGNVNDIFRRKYNLGGATELRLFVLEPGACNCPKNERCCSDGSTCVSIERFCDGVIDCDDRSDEQEEYCGCSLLDSFLCSSGKCIDKYLQCNNVNDCEDGEDEKFCEEESICPKNQLRNRLFTKHFGPKFSAFNPKPIRVTQITPNSTQIRSHL